MAKDIAIRGNTAGAGATQINNVNITPSYDAEEVNHRCLRALRCPDSHAVRTRLLENKDKLLRDSFDWILTNPEYMKWRNQDDIGLLWIKGDAGKGKTMMTIGLVEELSRALQSSTMLCYFFCQNVDDELNTTSAIVKGLISRLVTQKGALMGHLRRRWDAAKGVFTEDTNSLQTLWNIFLEILSDPGHEKVYVVVDALDECDATQMSHLLRLIVRTGLHSPSKIKWLLTSRPLESAECLLQLGPDQLKVSLELNSAHVSMAVRNYIRFKVGELSNLQRYSRARRAEVELILNRKAEDTFLWVSLVSKSLEDVPEAEAVASIQGLPPGLQPLYDRMMRRIRTGNPETVAMCEQILGTVTLAYRPLHMEELGYIAGLPEDLCNDLRSVDNLLDQCAPFLTVRKNIIYFVHQSAKDYMTVGVGQEILTSRQDYGHDQVSSRCLNAMSKLLKINIGGLSTPSSRFSDVPLGRRQALAAQLGYACCYWIQHLAMVEKKTLTKTILADHGKVDQFLRQMLLRWLEVLSLIGRISEGARLLKLLRAIINEQSGINHKLDTFIYDAGRFLMQNQSRIEQWPLQTYSSALLFSPIRSLVRNQYLGKIPKWIKRSPKVELDWGSLLQTLEGHSSIVNAVMFSPDGKLVASASEDHTVKLWDAETGALRSTLEGHQSIVTVVVFSPDGKLVASASEDHTVRLWDAETGALRSTLEGHRSIVTTAVFSPDGKLVASASEDHTVRLWDVEAGALRSTLEGHRSIVNAVVFSPDGKLVASASRDYTVRLWDAVAGALRSTLEGHRSVVTAVVFSPDGKLVASASRDHTVRQWDTGAGALRSTLEGHSSGVTAVVFSPDGKLVASASEDHTVRLWDAEKGALRSTLMGHSSVVTAVMFSPDGNLVASASWDHTVRLWDAGAGALHSTLEGHSSIVNAVVFSPDGKLVASASWDYTVRLWDAGAGALRSTLEGHSSGVTAVVFSPDGKLVASASGDHTVMLWDAEKGALRSTLEGHSSGVSAVVFSPDGKLVASASWDHTVRLWDTRTDALRSTLEGHSSGVGEVVFSPDGKLVASASWDHTVRLWDTRTGALRSTLKGHSSGVSVVVFSPDGKLVASASWDHTVRLWDAEKVLSITGWRKKVRLMKARASPVIKVINLPAQARYLTFSADGTHLASDQGYFELGQGPLSECSLALLSSGPLYIKQQWLSCGVTDILWLPSEYRPTCYDVRDNHIALGLASGPVIFIEIDMTDVGC